MSYSIVKFFVVRFCKLFIKEIKGLENIPKGGFVLASNHASLLDPPIVSSIIADKFNIKVHNLGKKELFESFFGNIIHKSGGTIPIDTTGKNKDALGKAIEYLKKGKIIGIFPEGGRSFDGKLQRGKTGVARLALKARVPVVPVGLKGTYKVWPRQKKLFKIKKIVEVNFGKPIYFDKYYNKAITKTLLRSLTTIVMRRIGELCSQKYNY